MVLPAGRALVGASSPEYTENKLNSSLYKKKKKKNDKKKAKSVKAELFNTKRKLLADLSVTHRRPALAASPRCFVH